MDARVQNRIALLVEDSDDDAFFFERAMDNAGVSVPILRFADGDAAIQHLEKLAADTDCLTPPYVLFLDLKLPVLSGFDVLRWIRERGFSIEVVVLSGSDLDSDIQAARELGASQFLVKPISAIQLRERLGHGNPQTVGSSSDKS
jgi:CheY-like chemotaxis protein